MADSEILAEWVNKRVMVLLQNTGHVIGELVRIDALGGLFEVLEYSPNASTGLPPLGKTEYSRPMYSFIPWTQIEMIVPSPGELP